MYRILLLILLFFIVYYIGRLFIKDISTGKKKENPVQDSEELVQDPYCETYISKRTAFKKKIAGNTYFFCSESCLEKYLKRMNNH